MMKHVNLRQIRKDYPDMPDCCQRCQLFLQGGEYREGRLTAASGYVKVCDAPPFTNEGTNVVGAIQCRIPDELRNKTGDIPVKYVHHCSEFFKEDIQGAEIVAVEGNAGAEACKHIGLDKEMDIIKLSYKDHTPNEYAANRLQVALTGGLVSPELINMCILLDTIEENIHNPIIVGLDFEWNPDEMKNGKVTPHTIGLAYNNQAAYDSMGGGNRAFLRRLAANPNVTIVGHDLARAEIQRLFDMGIHDIRCKFEDSMTTTWELMDRAGNVALKDLCYKHLPIENYWYDIDDYSTYTDKLGAYCAKDAWASLYYLDGLKKEYADEYKEMKVAHDLDMQMLLPTAYMMWKGIGLNSWNVQKRIGTAKEKLHDIEVQFHNLGGVNPHAPAQLLDYIRHTFNTNLKSTDSKLLAAVHETASHELKTFIDLITEYRQYAYILGKLEGDLSTTPDGIIHPYIKVAFANTGRPSYSQPNIANIPANMRDVIQSTHGENGCLITYDRGQSEYRCMAYLAYHQALIKSFQDGIDIHTYAAKFAGIDRTPCKTLNFAYLYYANDNMLLAILRDAGIKDKDLNTRLSAFKECMLDVREWQDDFIAYCMKLGYMMTPNGRRGYRLRPTAIVNFPIQSWSSDLNKMTLLHFFNRMREEGLRSHIWLEFFDGVEIDAVKEEVPVIQQIAKEVFTILPDVLDYGVDVPFPIEETIHGRYWGE